MIDSLLRHLPIGDARSGRATELPVEDGALRRADAAPAVERRRRRRRSAAFCRRSAHDRRRHAGRVSGASRARAADAASSGSTRRSATCMLTDPLGYIDFLSLTSHARLILTDSGGLQEESTALGIPCLTLRENTERPITVTQGTNQVVGTDTGAILAGFGGRSRRADSPRAGSLGRTTAERITRVLCEFCRADRAFPAAASTARGSRWRSSCRRVRRLGRRRAVRRLSGRRRAPDFYQSEFGPAVMLACGRGFQDPDTRTAPALAAFLSQQSDSVRLRELPPAIATSPLTAFQRASRVPRIRRGADLEDHRRLVVAAGHPARRAVRSGGGADLRRAQAGLCRACSRCSPSFRA